MVLNTEMSIRLATWESRKGVFLDSLETAETIVQRLRKPLKTPTGCGLFINPPHPTTPEKYPRCVGEHATGLVDKQKAPSTAI